MGLDARLLCKILPKIWKASHRTAIIASLFYLISSASAQTTGSPNDSGGNSRVGVPQICDGQESGQRNHVSLQRQSTPADGPQMSKLETDPEGMQSEAVSQPAGSQTPGGTEQHPLQCIRVHPDKDSQNGDTSTGTAVPIIQSGPKVTLTNGMLTVDPHNASLGDILGAVRAIAGFQLDIPHSEMGGRVFDQIGPLPVREALVQLLYGSGFNYIIQTAPENLQQVTHLIVTSRTGAVETAAAGAAQQSPDQHSEQALYGGFEDTSAEDEPAPQPAIAQPMPINAANIPGVPVGFNLKKAAEEAHKTPGEILDELQKRQNEILDAQSPPPPQ